MEFSIAGRKGISSTGIFHNRGEAGNIPSGESYIAPLEDEKVLSTSHIAFGSNKSFGGTTEAGVHIDCVTTDSIVYLDGIRLELGGPQS